MADDLPDLTDASDDYLEALAVHVNETREARRRHATIPSVIASLATQYADGGGDRAELLDAVQARD